MDEQAPAGPGPWDCSDRQPGHAGRRGNGLSAGLFSALTEIDPRLAGTALDALAAEGIAAWVRPFAGTRGGYLEVHVPARPLDCLYVDASRRAEALAVLTAQVPDLLGLRDRETDETEPPEVPRDSADEAGGDRDAGEPDPTVNRAAAGNPVDSGASEGDPERDASEQGAEDRGADGAAGSGRSPGPEGGLDIEAAFAAIVAGYAREAQNPREAGSGAPDTRDSGTPGAAPPGIPGPPGPPSPTRAWLVRGAPGPDDLGPVDASDGHAGAGDPRGGDPHSGRVESGARDSDARDSDARDSGARDPGARDSDARDPGARDPGARDSGPRDWAPTGWDPTDSDHYEPPPPPRAPSPSQATKWALVSIALGLILLVAPALVALEATDLVHVGGVLAICGGVGVLVARMRHGGSDDDDPDDGAVI